MVVLLGLTGNIACGKSSVGHLLASEYGADYVDADRLVHALYAAGTPETAAIVARFGPDLLDEDGTIDRRRLGDIVLADRLALRELEHILDPGVKQQIAQRMHSTSATVLVLDAIRLIESGLAARCQVVWVVVCDERAQLQRLQDSRGFKPEQARLRVTAQTSAETKLSHATATIENRGTLDDLRTEVQHAWRRTVDPLLAAEAHRPSSGSS